MAGRRASPGRMPSQIRYDQAHPSISLRLPAAVVERLRVVAERDDQPLRQWIADTLLSALVAAERRQRGETAVRRLTPAPAHQAPRGLVDADADGELTTIRNGDAAAAGGRTVPLPAAVRVAGADRQAGEVGGMGTDQADYREG